MAGCCESEVTPNASRSYRRALGAVIAINAVMFVVEMGAGAASGSQALKADALDFAGDTATYGLSLLVLGASIRVRASAALFKSLMLAAIAIWVLATTIGRFLNAAPPDAPTMGIVGMLALSANLASVLILLRWRDGDSNVRSVWLCSRNDAIGNVGVMISGALVALSGTPWPDLLVALLLASVFLYSATSIGAQALSELRSDRIANDSPTESMT